MLIVDIKKVGSVTWSLQISTEIARIVAAAASVRNLSLAARDVSVRVSDFGEYDYYDRQVEITIDINDRPEIYELRDVVEKTIGGGIKEKKLINATTSIRLRFTKILISYIQ